MDTTPPISSWSRFAAAVQRVIGLTPELQAKLLISLIVILVLWLVRWAVVHFVVRRARDPRSVYASRKWATNITVLVGILIVGRVLFAGFQSLATYIGLLSAGLAIALKDLLINFAGWVFILWRKPFEVGDRIQISGHAGDVIDLRIFQFSLLEIGNWVASDQPTGRIAHVPNGKVFVEPQFNYTKGFNYIWNEIPVLVTFESNWRKAKGILETIAARHAAHVGEGARQSFQDAARKFLLSVSDLAPQVFVTVPDSGVRLTIRYLCDPRQRRVTEAQIWEDILADFAACKDIDFAYPTTRFYDNALEGKEEARADSRPKP
jgi:small-conductance mechanosensitive channel